MIVNVANNVFLKSNSSAQDNNKYIQTGMRHVIKRNGAKAMLLIKNNENEKQIAVNNAKYLSKFKKRTHSFCVKRHAKKE